MKDSRAQISAELLFLFGVLVLVFMISVIFIANQNELNTAMAAARSGAIEGIALTSSGIYPIDTYREYSNSDMNILNPYCVELVNVSYLEIGMDNNYNKKRIQFKVYAKSSKEFNSDELVSIGDRINYNLRKSVAISFNSTVSLSLNFILKSFLF